MKEIENYARITLLKLRGRNPGYAEDTTSPSITITLIQTVQRIEREEAAAGEQEEIVEYLRSRVNGNDKDSKEIKREKGNTILWLRSNKNFRYTHTRTHSTSLVR